MVIFLSCLETSISIQDSDDSCKVEHETQHTRKLSIDSQKSTESSSTLDQPKFKKLNRSNLRKRSTSRSKDENKSKRKKKKHRSRSKSRKRSNSREHRRKQSKSRKRSKERKRPRSRDRNKRSRSKNRRRSNSRDRKRSKSRDHKRSRKRSSSRDRRHRRTHRRSRSRSQRRRRSRERKRRSRSSSESDYIFGHDRAMDEQERLARRLERAKELTKIKHKLDGKSSENGFNINMAAHEAKAKAESLALKAKVFKDTGVELPSFYNPQLVNPTLFAQQQAKRNKLWSKAKEKVEETEEDKQANRNKMMKTKVAGVWSSLNLGDEKKNKKFAKLMGIKQSEPSSDQMIHKQAELFNKLDEQYTQARISTHTQRGVGLGYSSGMVNPNMPVAKPPQ